MTNKDYKRLTTGGYANTKLLREYRDRLYELENEIENGTLAFLPCKVGDKFWWISGWNFPDIIEEKVSAIRVEDSGFVIYDDDDTMWLLDEIYFTKEEAEKVLEELKK